MKQLDVIVRIANSYSGMKEGTLDHLKMVDFYNYIPVKGSGGYHLEYEDAWCAAFVSVVMRRAHINSFPTDVSVFSMWRSLESQGCQVLGRCPMPGELVFYKHSHVGIVENWVMSDWVIKSIEGNSGDMVAHRQHHYGDTGILGYMSPRRYTKDEIIEQVKAGIWGEGEYQDFALKICGYDKMLVN